MGLLLPASIVGNDKAVADFISQPIKIMWFPVRTLRLEQLRTCEPFQVALALYRYCHDDKTRSLTRVSYEDGSYEIQVNPGTQVNPQ
jgi:hypothetical protein